MRGQALYTGTDGIGYSCATTQPVRKTKRKNLNKTGNRTNTVSQNKSIKPELLHSLSPTSVNPSLPPSRERSHRTSFVQPSPPLPSSYALAPCSSVYSIFILFNLSLTGKESTQDLKSLTRETWPS